MESRIPNFCHCSPELILFPFGPIPHQCPNFGESRFSICTQNSYPVNVSRIPGDFPSPRDPLQTLLLFVLNLHYILGICIEPKWYGTKVKGKLLYEELNAKQEKIPSCLKPLLQGEAKCKAIAI